MLVFMSMISRPCSLMACHCYHFLSIAICQVADELDDFIEGTCVVIPDDNRALILLHGIGCGLKAKVGFIWGHTWFLWRAVKGFEKKIDGATHVFPEFWRKDSAERIVRDGRDVHFGDRLWGYSQGHVRGG